MDRIFPALTALATPIDTLRSETYRRHDIPAIKRSIERFGQRRVIVASANGTVTAGNGTLEAMRQLGATHVAAILTDDDVTTARAFAIADNRSHELGADNDAELLAWLDDLDEATRILVGYADDDLDDLRAALEEGDAHLARLVTLTDADGDHPFAKGDGAQSEPSFPERLDKYRELTVRSIILDYPLDLFERVAAAAATAREQYECPTNSELFARLLGDVTGVDLGANPAPAEATV